MNANRNRSIYMLLATTSTLVLSMAGCDLTGVTAMTDDEEATIQIKENPNPQKAYRLTMTIEDAPGPFAMVEGSAQYDVTNHQTCGRVMPVSRTVSRINTNPPIKWNKESENMYTTVVYTDLMVDEDYYGHGLCKWEFTEARARIKATSADFETRFVPAISLQEVLGEAQVKIYFPKQRYPHSDFPDFADFGHQDPTKYREEVRPYLFSITIRSEEI